MHHDTPSPALLYRALPVIWSCWVNGHHWVVYYR